VVDYPHFFVVSAASHLPREYRVPDSGLVHFRQIAPLLPLTATWMAIEVPHRGAESTEKSKAAATFGGDWL
jgi:hypothetical protein